MTDLRKTQPEWTRFLGRELGGAFLAALYELTELEARYREQRVRIVAQNDVDGVVGPEGVQLTGVDLFRNTSPEGRVFVRIAGPQATSRVQLYLATGGLAQTMVASGQGPSGSLITLKEANDSGLVGRFDLAPGAARQGDDALQLVCVPDWLTQVDRIWDGSQPRDHAAREVFRAALAEVAASLADARQAVFEALVQFATGLDSRGAAFLEQRDAVLFDDALAPRDASGAVARRRIGFLESLRRAMDAETRAGPQAVTARRVTAAAAVFPPSNRGKGRVAPHAPREFAPGTRWTFRCVRGGDTGHGGRETFEGTARLPDSERELRFSGLVVNQSFSGPGGLGPLTLERLYRKDGDPTDQTLAGSDAVRVLGERNGNTDNGILHWRVTEQQAGYDVGFFRSAVQGSGDLVAQAEAVQPGEAFVARERSASGLSVLWTLGPVPQPGATGTLDCQFFVVEGPDGRPDTFTLETQLAPGAGLFQALLAANAGGALRSAPPGQETVPDSFVQAGSLVSLLLPEGPL